MQSIAHIPILFPSKDHGELFRNRNGYFQLTFMSLEMLNLRSMTLLFDGRDLVTIVGFLTLVIYLYICSFRKRRNRLLGDNGYPFRRCLMIPVLHPNTDAERRYNTSQCRSRVNVENLFGVCKKRFPCLSKNMLICLTMWYDRANNKLNIKLEPHEISRSHRPGPLRNGSVRHRNIVVKLAIYNIRKRIYDVRRLENVRRLHSR